MKSRRAAGVTRSKAIVLLLLSTIILIPAILGLGALIAKLLALSSRNLFEFGSLGIFGLALGGTLIHFLLPLNAQVDAMFIIAGLSAFVIFRKQIFSAFDRSASLLYLPIYIGLFILTLSSTPSYDTGLYHLPTILWNQQDKLTLGLGNLHGRLAFNSSWYVIASCVSLFPTGLASVFSVNFIFAFLFISAFVQHAARNENMISVWYCFAVLLFLIGRGAGRELLRTETASPSSDFPVAILILFCVYLTLVCLEEESEERSSLLIVLSVLAITIKLSSLPILLLPLFVLAKKRVFTACHKRAFLAAGVLTLLWCARGVGLSGCAFYPTDILCAESLPWAVPKTAAVSEANWIYSWARNPQLRPSEVLGNWNWLPVWFHSFWSTGYIKTLFHGFLLGVLLIVVSFFRKPERTSKPQLLWIFLFLLAGCGFWFIYAPHPRFGLGWLIALPSLLVAFGLQRLEFSRVISQRMCTMIVVLIFIAFVFYRYGSAVVHPPSKWPLIPAVVVKEEKTTQGIAIKEPMNGDQCWDTPLPCTPYMNPQIQFAHSGIWTAIEAPE